MGAQVLKIVRWHCRHQSVGHAVSSAGWHRMDMSVTFVIVDLLVCFDQLL